ncbi:MAG: dTMP kinase [Pseudomonadota bacterium]
MVAPTADQNGRAPFIVFEGGDGAGKTTQINRLAVRLRETGRSVLMTREPGGSPGAEDIRALIVSGDPDRYTALSETLLVYAARHDHLTRTINPARARGEIVLCDRFSDSTRAYQGHAGQVDLEVIETIDGLVVDGDGPDLTIVLDAGLVEATSRATNRGGTEDRFERKGAGFQEAVINGFRTIATANPKTHILIDANRSIGEIHQDIWDAVSTRFHLVSGA